MAEITASMVKELREKTDAPMMECKKALAEAGGDLAKAEEILRVKLGNKASKAAARVAAEGVVAVTIAGKVGAMAKVTRWPWSASSAPAVTAAAKPASSRMAGSPGSTSMGTCPAPFACRCRAAAQIAGAVFRPTGSSMSDAPPARR